MSLLDNLPRQPTLDDIEDCDRQIALWRRRQAQAQPGTPWEAVCENIINDWLDLRAEIAPALEH